MGSKHCFLTILLLALLLCACRKVEKFAVEPHIEFVSLEPIDEPYNGMDVRLTFKFQDGDGDIGLDNNDLQFPFDTSSIYYYNCFITYFEKQNGVFVEVELPSSLNMRIPRLSDSTPESISGEIYLDLYANNPFSPYDTIRYELFIVDRALNHSNTITTTEYITN
ncbi:MAG: hypothetical protein IKO62_06540 [Bacteroidales bacterium]|nr:hypothetical protein [Bacteroidales bacterium]